MQTGMGRHFPHGLRLHCSEAPAVIGSCPGQKCPATCVASQSSVASKAEPGRAWRDVLPHGTCSDTKLLFGGDSDRGIDKEYHY